jgi:large subunit ribosomal protein L10
MTPKRETPVPEYKKKLVAELSDLIKNKKTILLASVKNLPGPQYQQIIKKIRDKAVVKLPKKNLFFRAVEASKNAELKKIEEIFHDSTAVLFSDLDTFDLSADLIQSKTPAKAKVGQEAPEDITIEAGPTDLLPGPAISELGAVGLKIEIKDGKINIKDSKVIVKKGEEISEKACDVMGKLDIQPFSIGFMPLSAYDTQEKKFYREININPEETLEELKSAYGKALALAVSLNYTTEDTINLIIGKAGSHEKALEKFDKVEEKVPPALENINAEGKEKAAEEPKVEEGKTSKDVPTAPENVNAEGKEDQTPEEKTDEAPKAETEKAEGEETK